MFSKRPKADLIGRALKNQKAFPASLCAGSGSHCLAASITVACAVQLAGFLRERNLLNGFERPVQRPTRSLVTCLTALCTGTWVILFVRLTFSGFFTDAIFFRTCLH